MTRVVSAAVEEVTAAAAHAWGVLEAADRSAAAEFDRRHEAAQSSLARAQREGAAGTTQAVGRDLRAGRELAARLAPGLAGAAWGQNLTANVDLLATATHVRLGTLDLPGGAGGLPLVVPLVDSGNLILSSGFDADLMAQIHGVVLRALLGTGIGQLVLHGFDPAVRGLLAPFAPLRQVAAPLLGSVATTGEELNELLQRLTEDVQRVNDLRRGRAVTLDGLRRAARQPVEKFQLVVLLDHPRGVTEEQASRLDSLMRSGPACGVSFVVHQDRALSMRDYSQVGEVINVQARLASWGRCPEASVTLDAPPAARVVADAVQAAALTANSVAAPHLGLADMLGPGRDAGGMSSADGIRAPIGRAGTDDVDLVLGDEREQRHNVLVTGAVGQGKSNFLKVLIHSLAARYEADELVFYLIDLKEGVSFYPLASTHDSPDWLPQAAVIGLESDREFAVAVLESLFTEFERRARLIRPHGDKLSTFRAKVPGAVMPRILVVLDEFQVLFEEDDQTSERAVDLVERLARRGRAYGIHLVLASQTISGITAMLGKQDGIYSQFPIRIAFKNSVSESLAVLDTHNPDAAQLRFRGEAIVNLDFGLRQANRRVVVASADQEELDRVRQVSWSRRPGDSKPPQVFRGSEPTLLTSAVDRLRELRAQAHQTGSGRVGLLGLPIALPLVSDGVALTPDAGRHLAVLGGSRRRGDSSGGNLALGAIQAAAVSLALQHPAGDAEFMLLDMLSPEEAAGAGMKEFAWLMERLGFPLRTVHLAELSQVLKELNERVSQPYADGALYVLAAGMDRAGSLDRQNEDFSQDIDLLRGVLRNGPVRRTHVLGWWSSVGVYRSHLGYDASVEVDSVLALRVSQRDIVDVMGHTVTWTPRDNRGLLYDRHEFAQPVTLVPMAPLDASTARAILRVGWD